MYYVCMRYRDQNRANNRQINNGPNNIVHRTTLTTHYYNYNGCSQTTRNRHIDACVLKQLKREHKNQIANFRNNKIDE